MSEEKCLDLNDSFGMITISMWAVFGLLIMANMEAVASISQHFGSGPKSEVWTLISTLGIVLSFVLISSNAPLARYTGACVLVDALFITIVRRVLGVYIERSPNYTRSERFYGEYINRAVSEFALSAIVAAIVLLIFLFAAMAVAVAVELSNSGNWPRAGFGILVMLAVCLVYHDSISFILVHMPGQITLLPIFQDVIMARFTLSIALQVVVILVANLYFRVRNCTEAISIVTIITFVVWVVAAAFGTMTALITLKYA